MKRLFSKRNIILFFAVLICCFRLIYLFSLRTSHFVDEVYSCGFACSIGDPMFFYPVTDENGTETVVHLREWFDGSELKDYVTINDWERFDFAGTLENKTWDTAPPNFELMLHFVCSLFPGTFSWKYPFSINLVFFTGSLILVFRISRKLIKTPKVKDLAAFTCVFFFSLSVCGTGAYTYLRMYGVVCFYALLLTLGTISILDRSEIRKGKYYLISFISFFFGLFTHTTYVVFAFSLILFSCLLLLLQKRFRTFFSLGFSALGSLCFFLLLYPYVILNRFGTWMSNENTNSYSYFTRLTFSNMTFFGRSIGFYIRFTGAGLMMFFGMAFLAALIIVLFGFLFRKEKWFKTLKARLITLLCSVRDYLTCSLGNVKPETAVLALSAILYMLLINAVAPMLTMSYTTRYMFSGMQIMLIAFIVFVFSIWDSVKGKARKGCAAALYALLIMLLLNQKYYFGNQFIFNGPYDDEDEFTEFIAGQNVLVFGYHYYDFHNLISTLRDVDTVYFGKYNDDEINEHIDLPDDDCYIMANRACFNDDDPNFSSNILDGVRKAMTTEEFVLGLLGSEDVDCEYVRDFYSFDGLYAVYHVIPVK